MYSKGISWINDCRIPFVDEKVVCVKHNTYTNLFVFKDGFNIEDNTQGRFPANILVSDDMLNDGVISKSTIFDGTLMDMTGGNFGNTNNKQTDKRIVGGYADKGTNSRYYDIDKWFDKLLE
jgi:hypothetical protein